MAAMTSCENTQYMYFKNSFGYDAPDLDIFRMKGIGNEHENIFQTTFICTVYISIIFFSKIELKKCGNRQKMLLDGCYLFS